MARANGIPTDSGVANLLADVLEDCAELMRFRGRKLITRAEWDTFPVRTQRRMIKNEFVVVSPRAVYLTPYGEAVLNYDEVNGDG